MQVKYKIHDILAYNKQGVFSVGIVTKITIVVDRDVIYHLDSGADILESNIIKLLGNAKEIKDSYETN
jgi:hypothetical protein